MATEIEITEITIRPAKDTDGPLRAYVNVVLNDAFAVNGLRVVEGKSGFFVAFPREYPKKTDGKGYNVCFPITRETSAYFTAEVLREYKAVAP